MSLLSPLRHEGLSPSRVDLELAVRRGQRRRRTRRAATVLGSGMLALLVITAAVVTTDLLTGRGDPPVISQPPGWGLDRQRITAEPPGYELTAVAMLGLTQRLNLIRRIGDKTVARATVILGAQNTRVAGPLVAADGPVQGHSAYWSLSCDQPGCLAATLNWEWTSGNWVSVSVSVDAAADQPDAEKLDARSEATLVAEAVRTDVSIPVRTPIMTLAPPGTRLQAVSSETTRDGSIGRVSLFFSDQSLDQSTIFATVTLRNDYVRTASNLSGTVGGKPAEIHPAVPAGSPASITVPDWAGGWTLEVRSSPDQPFEDTATRVAFASQVTTVANPDDRSSWISLA